MTPQQLYDRITSDCSLLAKVFIDQERHNGAATLARMVARLRDRHKHMSIYDQIAEMSDETHEPQADRRR